MILDMDLEHPALDENIRDWVKVFSTLKKLYFLDQISPSPLSLGTLNIVGYTGELLPKGVPFSGLRYMRGLFSIREENFVNLVYIKE